MPSPLLSNFTPSLMSPETLEKIFVQREEIAQDLVDRIILSATTPAKHHSLLIGARGMGKTHLVSLVYYRLQQHQELADKLMVAWMREDEWGIDSWLDLVVRIFRALGEAKINTKELLAQLQQVSITDAETLATRLLTKLIGDKTLLLIVENLNDLFAGLGEKGQQKFRSFLQERQCCTILATTPALFAGVQDRSEPFFGFFSPIPLSPLSKEEAVVILQKIAELEGETELANFLRTPAGIARVQAVHYLAGGNPRVFTLFSQFITRESLDELVQGFMKMLDDLTPYYQSRMKELSNQQRKIIEFLVDRREAVMVKEIATQCFVEQRVVSGQLVQLRNKGYVVASANGRESFYELAEVLMRLCMDVKKYRGQWVELVVDFLRIWYRPEERQEKLEMLRGNGGLISDEFLEFALKSNSDKLLSKEALSESEQWSKALRVLDRVVAIDTDSADAFYKRGYALDKLEKYDEAIASYDRAVQLKSDDHEAWSNRGISLDNLGKYDEAITSYDRAIELKSDYHKAWYNRGISLDNLGKYDEAITSYDRAIELKLDYHEAWYNRGISLASLERYEEAITSYDRAINIKYNKYEAWHNRGNSLDKLERYEEAIASYDRAIEFNPQIHQSWNNKGVTFLKWGKYLEAIDSYEGAISIKPDKYNSWHSKGVVLFLMGNYSESFIIWQKTFNIIHQKVDLPDVDLPYDVSNLIQEFIEELIPKFNQPAVKTMLTELVQTYIQTSVLTELGTALVRTLKQIIAPDISDYIAQKWLEMWKELLGDKPEMQLPFRLMNTAILYKQHPERKERLWLGLASEERGILDEALA